MLCPHQRFNEEFKQAGRVGWSVEKLLHGQVRWRSPTVLVLQTVGNWVNKWRKQHPDLGMSEATSEQITGEANA